MASSPAGTMGGAMRHLLRALQQHEAALEELHMQVEQNEAASSLLSHYLDPCFHSESVKSSSSSSASASSDCATSFVGASPCPRVFIPLTSEALLPGFLLPSSSLPLLHLGGDYLATFRAGKTACGSSTSQSACVSSASAAPSTNGEGESAEDNSGCGALGLLHRRESLLREQKELVERKVQQLRAQLRLGEEENDRRDAGVSAAGAAGVRPPIDGAADNGANSQASKKGQAHFTKDGFVEIFEDYTSEEESEDTPQSSSASRCQPQASGGRLRGESDHGAAAGPRAHCQADGAQANEASDAPDDRAAEPVGRVLSSPAAQQASEASCDDGGSPVTEARETSSSASAASLPPSASASALSPPDKDKRDAECPPTRVSSWSPAVAERVVERAESLQARGDPQREDSPKRRGGLSVGEAEEGETAPPKRVSIFKAMRQGQKPEAAAETAPSSK
ncbi:hypothetical protein BESB_065460 [Besnoitia besnoiti]|uniref:Uncharacterized protein n=1 Tax=Besnoitia besnoiti TaxID=94643 RepID=A0A2A9MBB9_BESBE|nr:hypothetical protein BESB_065460 [Besnoitia besnoiti]PFH34514.1 hypothetical protein BESB_065460 [Besnoitia besnoiti]